MLKTITSVLVFAALSLAQTSVSQPGDPRWRTVGSGASASRPANCTANRHVYLCTGAGCTSGKNIHYCTAANTWTEQGSDVAGSGTVTSVAATGGVETASGSAITETGTIRGAHLANAQTGTTYTVLTGDRGKTITFSNASAIAVTLPQAGAGFEDGWNAWLKNIGAGDVTVTPTTSTISGAATAVISIGEMCMVSSDGTNYEAYCNRVTAGGGITLTKSRAGVQVAVAAEVVTTSGTQSIAGTKKLLDANVSFADDGDDTKQFSFQVSGVTAGQNRVITVPDAAGTLAYQAPAFGGTGQSSYTKGDILVATDSTTLAKLSAGTDGDVLTADSAQTEGVKWSSASFVDSSVIRLREEFDGPFYSGTFSKGGRWTAENVSGTGVFSAVIPSETNHFGLWRFNTGATDTNASLLKGSNDHTTGYNLVTGLDAITFDSVFIWRGGSPTNTEYVIGFVSAADAPADATNKIAVKWLDGTDTPFQFRVCSASTCTQSASTINPAASTYHKLRIRSTAAGTILFSVDGETEVAIATNVPTGTLSPVFYLRTTAGSDSKFLWVDFFAAEFNVTR